MMNPEIRDRWEAALRSGEYQQGRGQLGRYPEEDLDGRHVDTARPAFCCLGVLCELAVADGVVTRDVMHRFVGYRAPDDEFVAYKFPPLAVAEWAGLTTTNPFVSIPEDDPLRSFTTENHVVDGQATLSALNDSLGADFARIADAVRQL